jgi:hypothetical protein
MKSLSYFPFDQLGLRGNPFQTLTQSEWAALALLPASVRAAWARGDDLQIVGEKGYGKTTLLLGLAARARREGRTAAYERLPEGKRHFDMPGAAQDVFLLDEAQRLDRSGRRLLRSMPTRVQLVIGSHTDLRPELTDSGRVPTSIRLGNLEAAHLAEILQRRLRHFSRDESTGFCFTESAVAYLLSKFGANQRAMGALLYEYFPRLPAPGPIEANALATLADDLDRNN